MSPRRNRIAENAASRGSAPRSDLVRWLGAEIVVTATALVGAVGSLVTGQPVGVALSLTAVAVVSATAVLRARLEFRRGWREGYESAAELMLDWTNRRTSAAEVRAALMRGAPTPEPWDAHTPIDTSGGPR